jgi:hypothetical protein
MQSKRVLERNLSGGSFLLYRKKGPALPALDAGKQQQGFESGVKRARMHSQSSSDDGEQGRPYAAAGPVLRQPPGGVTTKGWHVTTMCTLVQSCKPLFCVTFQHPPAAGPG